MEEKLKTRTIQLMLTLIIWTVRFLASTIDTSDKLKEDLQQIQREVNILGSSY